MTDETNTTTTVTAGKPLRIKDLEKRIAILKAAGVRSYRDGGVSIDFERVVRWSSGRPADEVPNGI